MHNFVHVVLNQIFIIFMVRRFSIKMSFKEESLIGAQKTGFGFLK